MTEVEASKALRSVLDELGVTRGETIYLAIDMARLPLPHWPVALNRNAIRDREDRWCAFLFEHIIEALGPHGTLLIGTFSYSCGNPEIPFVVEETRSEIGPFTNWVRQQPQSIRSLHPIFSVTGIGPKAGNILTNTGGAAFGPCSPFGRLTAHGARFVNLGIPFRQSLTYVHHLEQCYGCNHRYHKTFSGVVFQNGQKVKREFLGYMRWRGVDAGVDVGPMEEALKKAGLLREVSQPCLFGQSARAIDIDHIGYQMLIEDSRAFSTPKIRVDIDDSMVSAAPGKNPVTTFKLFA
jgi:aminoglycoside N3'-acetyltransferase